MPNSRSRAPASWLPSSRGCGLTASALFRGAPETKQPTCLSRRGLWIAEGRVTLYRIGYGHSVGIASDSNEVRRLRYAFERQGLRLRVQRATTYEDHLRDDLLWTIVRGDEVIKRDVSLDELLFMAQQFSRSRS